MRENPMNFLFIDKPMLLVRHNKWTETQLIDIQIGFSFMFLIVPLFIQLLEVG